ncbi:MAG TPA: tetratricopeptide repeat protein [Chthoniobacterales bacterium]|jgi:TolB-like protein/Tfp pilus assembly protein PilF|nr:tetratricopeptide repeat protein [Chthoniobacterales bacterium]
MANRNFFSELKRRNVYKVAVAYAIVGWLLVQVATQVFPFLEIPNWVVRLVIALVAIAFPIALVLAWAFEVTPQGIERTEVADRTPAAEGRKKHIWIYVVVISAAISVALFFLGRYTARNTTASRTNLSEDKTAGSRSPSSKSVAILPFTNLSRDADNAYFAAGVQDEIVTRLSSITELKAISCNSLQRFKAAPDDLAAIAQQLGVAHVLKGSVQKLGDAVRVNVQLIKADNEAQLWGDTFDRKLTDVFSIESDIAKTIAAKLQAKLTGSEERAISVKPTADIAAHQLYLQGRYLWNRRTAQNLKKALNYFEQAAKEDPNYALAYVGIADTCGLFPVYGAGAPQESLPKAKAAAEKALALDDSLAEAHASMGLVHYCYFDGAESAKEFERAIQLNPNYATAHHWYGRLTLVMLGQLDRAMVETKRAYELDPVSSIIHSDLGGVNLAARRYDEAIQQLRGTVEMDPDFFWARRWLGMALELTGDTQAAIAEYQKAFELNDDPAGLAFIAHADAARGRQDDARKRLAQLTDAAKSRYVQPYAFALIHLSLGDKNQALNWLEQGVRDRGATYLQFIKTDAFFDSLRGEPRFEALVQQISGGGK